SGSPHACHTASRTYRVAERGVGGTGASGRAGWPVQVSWGACCAGCLRLVSGRGWKTAWGSGAVPWAERGSRGGWFQGNGGRAWWWGFNPAAGCPSPQSAPLRRTVTVLEPSLATATSGAPSPSKSPTATDTGPRPAG